MTFSPLIKPRLTLSSMFVKLKTMFRLELLVFLDITDIVTVSRLCTDINKIVDVNRHN